MSTEHLLTERLNGSIAAVTSLRGQLPLIARISDLMVGRLAAGGTLYTAGNGGSAAEAMHLSEELIGRYRGDRRPLRAICLNADPAALTCIANDYGFEHIFARQCEALLTPEDVLVVMSTSGNSGNLVKALHVARARKAITIGLLGRSGGACLGLCDHAILVPADDSAHIQEAHQVVLHMVCEVAESHFRKA